MTSACLLWTGLDLRQAAGVVEDLVPDPLWERVAPLLPLRPPRRHRFPGRKPAGDPAALTGIVFVLKPVSPGTSSRTSWWAALV
jgi:hypothetical protein